MKKLIVLAFLLSACATKTPEVTPVPFFVTVEAILATHTAEVEAGISTPVPTLEPGCEAHCLDGDCDIVCLPEEPFVQRTNWLLLGGDHRAHRTGTGWGNKTDVIVLVSVLETDPVEITIIQFPRNLYAPFSMGDTWLFAVWDQFGWQGLHQYFQEVFGVILQGVFYVDMDGFVQIVDEMGGIRGRNGDEVLAHLRDNENNWGMGSYDAEERVFEILSGLYFNAERMFFEDPIAGVDFILSSWGSLIQTDLSNVKQWYWIADTFLGIQGRQWNFHWIQFEEPYIMRGDTPIIQNGQPTRGMIVDPATNIKIWMECSLDPKSCGVSP